MTFNLFLEENAFRLHYTVYIKLLMHFTVFTLRNICSVRNCGGLKGFKQRFEIIFKVII
jgi:hypothetical protein